MKVTGLDKISPQQARYIKLGTMGKWEEKSLQDGTLRVMYKEVPHEMALSAQWREVRDLYLKLGRTPSTSQIYANQLRDFYECEEDTLWVTFSNGFLWWCFAHEDVEFLGTGDNSQDEGCRLRRTIGGWRNTDIHGNPLHMADLHGGLTKTAMGQSTISRIRPDILDYLVRKINGDELPIIIEARKAKKSLLASMHGLIKRLRPNDFEVFVDLIFSHGGWQRIGAVGSIQKVIDIEMMQPITGQRGFAQIKCSTDQHDLDHYVGELEKRDEDFMFYVYHSSRHGVVCDSARVRLIGPEQLAEMALKSGLFDWLLQKAG